MTDLGRYLCHLAEAAGHPTFEDARRRAGMTPRRFDRLAFAGREPRGATARRAAEAFGGSLDDFLARRWDPAYDPGFEALRDLTRRAAARRVARARTRPGGAADRPHPHPAW
jgi:hypothetical protein